VPVNVWGAHCARAVSVPSSFVSARDPDRGINVALLGPEALTSRAPLAVRAWLCETRPDRIVFVSEDEPELHVLAFDLFTIDGALPRPAG
jgi:hypothetical protein